MSTGHLVTSFDYELQQIDNCIAQMGGLAETELAEALEALIKRDSALAERVTGRDERIDALEREVHERITNILALRQPMAMDLRMVVAGLRIVNDLERIGDYAKNLAKRTIVLSQASPQSATTSIARLGKLVQGMVKNVLDAYIERDIDKAADVRRADQEVDQLHTSLFREFLTYMMEDPRNITSCTHLLFVAKNLERVGDHATNIAEAVHFLVSGTEPEARAKSDQASVAALDTKLR
jgi:phosphate transport system protein